MVSREKQDICRAIALNLFYRMQELQQKIGQITVQGYGSHNEIPLMKQFLDYQRQREYYLNLTVSVMLVFTSKKRLEEKLREVEIPQNKS